MKKLPTVKNIIASWKDKDEFELIDHLRKLARPGNSKEEIHEFDVLLTYFINTYIKGEGRDNANS